MSAEKVSAEAMRAREKVSAEAMRALIVVSKMISRNAFKNFTNTGKIVSLLKGTTLKEMLCR
jgi:hypothetical protein